MNKQTLAGLLVIWAMAALLASARADTALTPEQAANLVPRASFSEETFITGAHQVTISSEEQRRAILRPVSRDVQYRLILTYRDGDQIPAKDEVVTLSAGGEGARFAIRAVTLDANKILNIQAESTKPDGH